MGSRPYLPRRGFSGRLGTIPLQVGSAQPERPYYRLLKEARRPGAIHRIGGVISAQGLGQADLNSGHRHAVHWGALLHRADLPGYRTAPAIAQNSPYTVY